LMVGRRSPQSLSISRLTLQPETIPSCYRRPRHRIPTTFRTAPWACCRSSLAVSPNTDHRGRCKTGSKRGRQIHAAPYLGPIRTGELHHHNNPGTRDIHARSLW
jgi:hypothetical protein